MERDPPDPPPIPSIFDALRCTCGKAVGGVYCDGTHLRPPPRGFVDKRTDPKHDPSG